MINDLCVQWQQKHVGPAGSQLSDVDCQVTSVCACALVYLGEQVS